MIVFKRPADEARVSALTRLVLADLLVASGNAAATITSVARTPADQARVMFENLERYGVKSQRDLYARTGDLIIEVYEQGTNAGNSPDLIRAAMTEKIIEVGPERVSRHCADHALLNVVDVARRPLKKRQAFIDAAKRDPRVSNVIDEPVQQCIHLEVPQH